MKRPQLFLSIGAVFLIVILYQLPRVVVENDQVQEVNDPTTHTLEIPDRIRSTISELRRLLNEEENPDKKATFAHTLAIQYLDYGILDSAVMLGDEIANWSEGPSERAMDIYFKAFERSQNQDQAKENAEKSKAIIEQLLDKDPSDLRLKNKLAMTLVVSDNPMTGINMLREILAVDENNRQAILNLGLLAIQSGQFERAKERFEKLVSLDTGDSEARLYLAVSMIETGQREEADQLLKEILSSQDSIPAIKAMANEYLQER